MKKIYLLVLLSVVLMAGCKTENENEKKGLPATAKCIADDGDYQIYRVPFPDDSLKFSLYVYDMARDTTRFLLTTNPSADGWKKYYDRAYPEPISKIRTVQKVEIFSWPWKPLTILIQYCVSFHGDVDSFIFTEGKDEVIYLPTSFWCVGKSWEEQFVLIESYDYYRCGGRYNVIDAYDVNGRLISSMSLADTIRNPQNCDDYWLDEE